MENDLTCQKTPSGYIINREGKYGSSTFFLLKSREEVEKIYEELRMILNENEN